MNGIYINKTLVEELKSLNQSERVEILKDFVKTLKDVNEVGQNVFTDFEDMYSSLKTEKAKNEVVKVIEDRIAALTEKSKKIDTEIGCVSSLKCLILNGVALERNSELIKDLELMQYITVSC